MTTADGTPAVGGARPLPAPDAVARDYLLLALRLDQHAPGLVDGYFGPADLKARVDLESLRPPARLREDAAALRARLADAVAEDDRRAWLAAQLVALETQAAALDGAALPYAEEAAACFGRTPRPIDEAVFDEAAAEIASLLPGEGTLDERLAAWDARLVIEPDRVADVAAWLVQRFRERAAALFGLPGGEQLRLSLVRSQPWSGYTWYEGGFRSRVDINLDLPIRAPDLVRTISHETYPGHHLEHAWKEAELVVGRARLEASVLLINTPECLVSEGLADLGHDFAVPPGDAADLLAELFERAGLTLAGDDGAAAERQVAVDRARRRLAGVPVNAALLRHAEGASHEETLAYLRRHGRMTGPVAMKRLEFIDHPLWRTYVFVYSDGEELLRRWVECVPEHERAARFGRLLREQLTPGAIAAEIG